MKPAGYLINTAADLQGECGIFYDYIMAENGIFLRAKNAHLAVNLIMTDISDDGAMMEYGFTAAKDYTIPPTTATKEIGEKLYEGLANYLAEFIEEFRKVKLPPIGSVGPLATVPSALVRPGLAPLA